eukprot:scaffold2192_cov170-Amphora_coffeaeformis.AAC.22
MSCWTIGTLYADTDPDTRASGDRPNPESSFCDGMRITESGERRTPPTAVRSSGPRSFLPSPSCSVLRVECAHLVHVWSSIIL